MKVICISGKAQHGKDTFARYLARELEHDKRKTLIVHYADMLKWVCSQFMGWDGEKDEHGRWLLQYVGTNVVRAQDADFWADTTARLIKYLETFCGWDYVLIPDCRFPNEIGALIKLGFDIEHLRVIRPDFDNGLTEVQKNHPSETALDDVDPDYYIENRGGIENLRDAAETMAVELEGSHQLCMEEFR